MGRTDDVFAIEIEKTIGVPIQWRPLVGAAIDEGPNTGTVAHYENARLVGRVPGETDRVQRFAFG